ncbi:MAG: hypothetical protein RSB82_03590 [Victivallaceae bacterium]
MDEIFKLKLFFLLNEMFERQSSKLLLLAKNIIPNITIEDVLQPMDLEDLESNIFFKFEEGVLSGLGEARAAVFAFFKDLEYEQLQKESSDI